MVKSIPFPSLDVLLAFANAACACPFVLDHVVWFDNDGSVLGHFYQPLGCGFGRSSAICFSQRWPPGQSDYEPLTDQEAIRRRDRRKVFESFTASSGSTKCEQSPFIAALLLPGNDSLIDYFGVTRLQQYCALMSPPSKSNESHCECRKLL